MKPFYFSSLCFEELEHDLDSFRQLPAALEASTEIVGLEIACHKYAQILCQACHKHAQALTERVAQCEELSEAGAAVGSGKKLG